MAMPISLHARWIRKAISPRFAMSTFSNMGIERSLFDQGENFAEFDRLSVRHDHSRKST